MMRPLLTGIFWGLLLSLFFVSAANLFPAASLPAGLAPWTTAGSAVSLTTTATSTTTALPQPAFATKNTSQIFNTVSGVQTGYFPSTAVSLLLPVALATILGVFVYLISRSRLEVEEA